MPLVGVAVATVVAAAATAAVSSVCCGDDVNVLDLGRNLLLRYLAPMGDRAAPLCTVSTRYRHIELRLIEHVVRDVEAQWIILAPFP